MESILERDFYPTPEKVIEEMLKGHNVDGKIILEPSAGSGNIVEYLQKNYAKEVIACETNEKLRRIVESKCRVIADDFLKVQRGQHPTPADINLAFEIINHRDVKNLQTIISTEYCIDDIISLDEALGGRINKRSKGYQMNVAKDKNKNFRLRK